jgi:glycerophosphoryl diester phosphodiesterase
LLTFALLVMQTLLLAGITMVMVLGLALLTRRIYLQSTPDADLSQAKFVNSALSQAASPAVPSSRALARLMLLLLLVTPLAVWGMLAEYTPEATPVLITAHRGHARAAPENTLSAMRKAMESRADFAELDVQRTADGVVVLLHDRDLKRVAGDSRRVEDLTFDELRQLEVGSWFDPAFAGEKVPTLSEVIELCRGRMRLNIELKFYGPDRQLAADVAKIVRDQKFEKECIVTSLNLDALEVVRAHNANVRTGLIVSHAVGDISRLDVDVLSVRADFLSREVLRLARRQGREVHAWTVNDPTQMIRLMQRGVDNILTSDPDLAVRVREQWAALTRPERLLLAARLLLGLDTSDLAIDR